MTEQEWKHYKVVRQKAIRKYWADVLDEVRDVINDYDREPADRLWDAEKLIRERSRDAERIFDFERRSSADRVLMRLRFCGLVADEDLQAFSKETVEKTTPMPL